jgi:hypothetical protein
VALRRQQKIAVADDPERGLDHGAYVPLVAMYPGADVPVLQISMPALAARELFQLGQAFAPLRDEGVLVLGSGFITHNMRYAFRPGIPSWAKDFDAWAADALVRFDVDALLDFQNRAPAPEIALPTWEHYAPLLVAAGAVGNRRPATSFPITGFWLEGAAHFLSNSGSDVGAFATEEAPLFSACFEHATAEKPMRSPIPATSSLVLFCMVRYLTPVRLAVASGRATWSWAEKVMPSGRDELAAARRPKNRGKAR